mgnify:CR=1 FL=1
MSKNLSAQVLHYKNEIFYLKKTIASYNHSFVFLCANMERPQLCKAISTIKSSSDTSLPPAIRSFLSRNVNVTSNSAAAAAAAAVNDDYSTDETHPIVSSAEALTKWAKKYLERQGTGNGGHDSFSQKHIENEQDSSLALAETNFKLRDLEQQLHSSRAIREDLLNKALEAEQSGRLFAKTHASHATHATHATHVNTGGFRGGDGGGGGGGGSSKRKTSFDESKTGGTTSGTEMQQWKSKYYELQTDYEALQKQIEDNTAAGMTQKGKESNTPSNNQVVWFQTELKSAKNTIRQLRALVQAKQDKIDIMAQLKSINIPRRN